MNYRYKVVELFSGIGSQAKALQNIGMNIDVVGTCEWNIHALVAYDAMHNSTELTPEVQEMSKEEVLDKLKNYTLSGDGKSKLEHEMFRKYPVDSLRRIYQAIIRSHNFVDINELTGEKMPFGIDILTYSFPCQDLSNVGAFHGYNLGIDRDSNSRSSLLWQVGRILKEMKNQNRYLPRYLVMENVPTLLSERHRGNFQIWQKELEELGYKSWCFRLNAHDFGLPQNRPRLLMISVKVLNDKKRLKLANNFFDIKTEKMIEDDYKNSDYYKNIQLAELLRTDYTVETYLKEAEESCPNNTPSRQKIWEENPQLILEGDNKPNPDIDMIRTITTKQDRNPNSGNLYFKSQYEGKGDFRYLTPRECLLFMGFTDEDYENIMKNNTYVTKGRPFMSRDKVIRMAGNSIPVKLLEGVFLQLKNFDEVMMENGYTFKRNQKL